MLVLGWLHLLELLVLVLKVTSADVQPLSDCSTFSIFLFCRCLVFIGSFFAGHLKAVCRAVQNVYERAPWCTAVFGICLMILMGFFCLGIFLILGGLACWCVYSRVVKSNDFAFMPIFSLCIFFSKMNRFLVLTHPSKSAIWIVLQVFQFLYLFFCCCCFNILWTCIVMLRSKNCSRWKECF